jgi:hypothetical protein
MPRSITGTSLINKIEEAVTTDLLYPFIRILSMEIQVVSYSKGKSSRVYIRVFERMSPNSTSKHFHSTPAFATLPLFM